MRQQRISVRAIVKYEGKILLLKRANGRQSILGKYELPGGRLAYGEQPEDALRRYLHDDAGLHIQTVSLYDTVTYIDHDHRDIQYAVIVYEVGLPENGHTITLHSNYNRYAWKSLEEIQQFNTTDLTDLLLGILQQQYITDENVDRVDKVDVPYTTKDTVTIYTDGGSRGNPGPSAAGYIILNDRNQVIDQGGEFLGVTNNNVAEYEGVSLALNKAYQLGIRRIAFRIDSMLVVNQMKGIYRIKNRELWPVNERIHQLIHKFDHVTFTHINRQHNQLADGIVNKILDAHEG